MWKLGLRPCNSFSGNTYMGFSLQCRIHRPGLSQRPSSTKRWVAMLEARLFTTEKSTHISKIYGRATLQRSDCPASQVKKKQAHLLNREPLSWSCVSDLLLLIRRELAPRCNPRWLLNPNSSLTQYECGRMKPLLCPRHHRQVKQAVKT